MSYSSLSVRQQEARQLGEQRETIKFLNQNHILAYIVLTLILVSAGLWTEMVVSLIEKIFRIPRFLIPFWGWFLAALTFAIFAYVIVRFVIRIPLTSAFGL